MKGTRWFFLAAVIFLVVLLAGCMAPLGLGVLAGGIGGSVALGGGAMASSSARTSFSDRGTLELKVVPPNILELAAEAGKDLGYDAQRIGRNTLNLNSGISTGSSMLSGLTMGFAMKDVIMISLTQSGQGLDYTLTIYGKLGDDPTKFADNVLAQFRNKLEERLTK